MRILNNSEFSLGSNSTVVSPTKSIVNPGNSIPRPSNSTLITSIALLITIEFLSKFKMRYTKLGDWVNVITLLNEKTLTQQFFGKTID